MKLDEYGEVQNGQETYDEIAQMLNGHSVLIGWTDDVGSHYDILFCTQPHKVGNIQRGLHRSWEILYVAIVGLGVHGFDIYQPYDRPANEFSGYVAEKLRMGDNITNTRLTELILGVCEALNRVQFDG